MSDKYIIYDSKRKEYVTKEGRTAILNELVYETSKDENNALILDHKVAGYNLGALENDLEYPSGTLELKPASIEVINAAYIRKQLSQISEAIENIAMNSKAAVRDDVKTILTRVSYSLDNYLEFDLDDILIDGSLRDALDDLYFDEDDE